MKQLWGVETKILNIWLELFNSWNKTIRHFRCCQQGSKDLRLHWNRIIRNHWRIWQFWKVPSYLPLLAVLSAQILMGGKLTMFAVLWLPGNQMSMFYKPNLFLRSSIQVSPTIKGEQKDKPVTISFLCDWLNFMRSLKGG